MLNNRFYSNRIVTWLLLFLILCVVITNAPPLQNNLVTLETECDISVNDNADLILQLLLTRIITYNPLTLDLKEQLDRNNIEVMENGDKYVEPTGDNLRKEGIVSAVQHCRKSSKNSIVMNLPYSLNQHVGNYSCVFEKLNFTPIDRNIVNATLHFGYSDSRPSFDYSELIKKIVEECYFGGKIEDINWTILDPFIIHDGKLDKSSQYAIKFVEDSNIPCDLSKFNLTCKRIRGPHYFVHDPQSLSEEELHAVVSSLGFKLEYIRNILYCLVDGEYKAVHTTEEGKICVPNSLEGAHLVDPKSIEESVTEESKSSDTTFIKTTESLFELNTMPPATTETADNFALGEIEDETLLETTTIPTALCKDRDGKQITEKCNSDSSFNAVWSNLLETCPEIFNTHETTCHLNVSINYVMSFVKVSSEDVMRLTAEDINLISEALQRISTYDYVADQQLDSFYTVSNITPVDLRDLIKNFIVKLYDHKSENRSNILVCVIHPSTSKTMDEQQHALYQTCFNNNKIIPMKGTSDLENNLFNLHNLTNGYETKLNSKIFITLFDGDRLFNEDDYTIMSVISNVIKISTVGPRNSVANCSYSSHFQSKIGPIKQSIFEQLWKDFYVFFLIILLVLILWALLRIPCLFLWLVRVGAIFSRIVFYVIIIMLLITSIVLWIIYV